MKPISLLFLAMLSPLGLLAQSNATDAALEGWAKDPTGAGIPPAHITVRNTMTNVEDAVVANSEGYYRFSLLKIGEYELRAVAPGFKEYRLTGIQLSVGQKDRIDPSLQIGTAPPPGKTIVNVK